MLWFKFVPRILSLALLGYGAPRNGPSLRLTYPRGRLGMAQKPGLARLALDASSASLWLGPMRLETLDGSPGRGRA